MKVSFLLTVLAAAIEACHAVVTLNRGTSAWSPQRVMALLNAGNISAAMLPDFRAVKPTDIHIDPSQLEWGREMLRFSNSIANTGANSLQVRLGDIVTDPTEEQTTYFESLGLDIKSVRLATQELLDADKNVAVIIPDATMSNYHHSHSHLHITETSRFSLEKFNSKKNKWEEIPGRIALKQYFCLIDMRHVRPVVGSTDPDHYEDFDDGTGTYYNSCDVFQGVSPGWLDYYGAGLPGQEVSLCGLPAGIYRIIVTLNPSGWFLESDYGNNVGWTSFELERDSEGMPSVRETRDSKGGIFFDYFSTYSPTRSPSPTKSPYPTYSPTKSLSPTTTSSPSVCTGNNITWVDWFGTGCKFYEEYDLPGCPIYGDYYDEDMGSPRDNCCYCSETYSRSPSESPSPTTETRSPMTPYPTYPPFPTFPPVPTISPYPTYSPPYPTKSPSPTTTSSPSSCTGSTPNWTSWGLGCNELEEQDPSCEMGYVYIGNMGPAAENCCHCFGKLEVCYTTAKPKSSKENPTFQPKSNKPTPKPTSKPKSSKTSKPTTRPTSNKPTFKPTSQKPTSKPTSSKPTSGKPTTRPTSNKPTVKPTSQKPTPKPTSKPRSSKTSKPTARPTSNKPTFKPSKKPNLTTSSSTIISARPTANKNNGQSVFA